MDSRSDRGECCLRWNDHQTLLHGICNSLLTSEKFADVTLFCEGISLKCHKFLLSACSSYFEQIFSETELDHPIIILRDVVCWEMQALLHFIYKGELTTDEKKLGRLIELARSLRIKGIGDFGSQQEESTRRPRKVSTKRMKVDPTQFQQEKPTQNIEYINDINSLSERMVSLPPESQQLLGESISASIDAADFNIPETGFPFGSEYNESNPRVDRSMLAQYSETNTNMYRKKQVESEADISSDTSLLTSSVTPPVYKQYGEQNLLIAIKAVLDDGMKQVEACVKYGIPFTTLTRKIRLYKSCGGRLPVTQHKTGNLRSAKQEHSPQPQPLEEGHRLRVGQPQPQQQQQQQQDDEEEDEDEEEELQERRDEEEQRQEVMLQQQQLLIASQQQHHHRQLEASLTSSLSVENNMNTAEDRSFVDNNIETEDRTMFLNRFFLQDSSLVVPSTKSTKPSYKNYTEEHLKEAIKAVMSRSMRTSEASVHYGIPLTTLTRKIRSYKESGSLGVTPAMYSNPVDGD